MFESNDIPRVKLVDKWRCFLKLFEFEINIAMLSRLTFLSLTSLTEIDEKTDKLFYIRILLLEQLVLYRVTLNMFSDHILIRYPSINDYF